MRHVVVVGSGASAVHFSVGALERGWRVTMLDVGRAAPAPVRRDDSFADLKHTLEDPADYFLGPRVEGVLFPGNRGEYYGFPPHKGYIFEGLGAFRSRASGFEALTSFGRGGLAEAWTGGSFPFNAAELADFPVSFDELAPFYDEVARRIGISGASDDLARFMPVHAHLRAALDLDQHSRVLLQRYGRARETLNRDLRVWVGRSRAATTRDDFDGREGCTNLGRCLWGCPRESLYTPSITLRELERRPNFAYVPGRFVTRFDVDGAQRVTGVEALEIASGKRETHACDRAVLAAGTLVSSKIYLDSCRRIGGRAPTLRGLMDNRQVLLPFVNLSMLLKAHDPRTYQYHQLALGLEREPAKHYVHGLITTLKTALIHPIVQSVPFDMKSALHVFKNAHAALGILNVNFHDDRRDTNTLELEQDGEESRLAISYAPARDEAQRMHESLGTLRRALRKLGCIVPPGMAYVRPMGASVHYAGTLPMSATRAPQTTSASCECHDFAGLFFVDGTTLPFLPAKNLTFTLMANAARVASRAF